MQVFDAAGKVLPLNVTIGTIELKGFGADQSYTVTAPVPPISNYNGGPLYCHATGDANGITITIDEIAPSSFVQALGPIKAVNVSFQLGTNNSVQPLTWNGVGPGAQYDAAFPLDCHLVFTKADLSTAKILIRKPAPPVSTKNSLGMIVLGTPVTGGDPEGYFVNVPMGGHTGVDPTEYSSMSITWGGSGGVAGPIGGGSIP